MEIPKTYEEFIPWLKERLKGATISKGEMVFPKTLEIPPSHYIFLISIEDWKALQEEEKQRSAHYFSRLKPESL